jgi:hypothetical protein
MRHKKYPGIERFLDPRMGEYVAISADRSRVIAYGGTFVEVLDKVKELGTSGTKPPLIVGTRVLQAVAVFSCRANA